MPTPSQKPEDHLWREYCRRYSGGMEFTAEKEVNSLQTDNTKACRLQTGLLEKEGIIKVMIKMQGSRRRNWLGKNDGAKLKKRSAKVKPFLEEKSLYFSTIIFRHRYTR